MGDRRDRRLFHYALSRFNVIDFYNRHDYNGLNKDKKDVGNV